MVLTTGAACMCLGHKKQQGPVLEKMENAHLSPLNNLFDWAFRKWEGGRHVTCYWLSQLWKTLRSVWGCRITSMRVKKSRLITSQVVLRCHDFILHETGSHGEEKCQNKCTTTSGAKTKALESELTSPSRLCAALHLECAGSTVSHYSQDPHWQWGALKRPLKWKGMFLEWHIEKAQWLGASGGKAFGSHWWAPDEIHHNVSLKCGASQPHGVTCPSPCSGRSFLTLFLGFLSSGFVHLKRWGFHLLPWEAIPHSNRASSQAACADIQPKFSFL